jgi:hypothetical protein
MAGCPKVDGSAILSQPALIALFSIASWAGGRAQSDDHSAMSKLDNWVRVIKTAGIKPE